MNVRILGPVAVDGADGTAIDVPKERALLDVLALEVGHAVPLHRLIDGVWGDDVPATAAKTLQGLVFRLRRTLGPDAVTTVGNGYALSLDPDEVDVHRFEALVRRGAAAHEAHDAPAARAAFEEALALWRGEPLDDLADGELRAAQSARLHELRLLAVEGRIEAQLELGHHDDVLAELEALVTEHPLREGLWGQLMRALYRAGRQGDALRAYQRLRSTLAEELGIEPSPPLQRLEARILRQDPSLDLGAPQRGNLPVPASSFIGRAADVARVGDALTRHRLVTLVGPGGVGKTRLALETVRRIAERHADGVWWIDLAPLRDGDAALQKVASTLGASPGVGVAAVDALSTFLRNREVLLLLDNCEHLIGAVAQIALRLVETGPGVTVLATSRVALGLAGEHRIVIGPLPVPDAAGPDVMESDATRLFVERCAERGRPVDAPEDRRAAADLCRHLDGMPLAIELAAARANALSPTELVAYLGHRLDVLALGGGRGDDRHRTLRAALDWSYELLGADDRSAFDLLGVFPGDFDLAAARAVWGGIDDATALDRIGALVDTSMVTVVTTTPTRFRLLETLRVYALDHLDTATRDVADRRFSDHYRAFAVEAGRQIGPETEGTEIRAWVEAVQREMHNLRAAIDWSFDHDPAEVTLEFAAGVGWAWQVERDFRTCTAVVGRMVSRPSPPTAVRALALLRVVWPAFLDGDGPRAHAALEEAIAVARAAPDGDPALGWALTSVGVMGCLEGAPVDDVLPWFDQADEVHARLGATGGLARTTLFRCVAQILAGRWDEPVIDALGRAHAVLDAAGDDHHLGFVWLLRTLIAGGRGDSRTLGTAGRAALQQGNMPAMALVALAEEQVYAGDLRRAQELLVRAGSELVDSGTQLWFGVVIRALAGVASRAGDLAASARLWGASTTATPPWPGLLLYELPQIERARELLGDAFEMEAEAGRALSAEEALRLGASLRV